MNIFKLGQAFTLLLAVLMLLNVSSLFTHPSLGAHNPSASSPSDTTWNPVQPVSIADEDQSRFWNITHSGIGNIAANLSDNSLNKKIGVDSLEITSTNGTYEYFDIYHEYKRSLNFYMLNVFVLWWHGNETNAKFRLHLYAPDKENRLYHDFYDNFSGWKQIVLYFDKNFTDVGKVNLSLLKEIHISLETANVQGIWYLDGIIADVVSSPTPETYLAEYEWSLNRLLDHKDEKSGQVLAGWGASNDSRDYEQVYRLDITLPTFTEAYKITGNKTYLDIAKDSLDKAIMHLYSNETHLFSTAWNSTSNTYVDRLEILWGAVLLNSIYDFYSVSMNDTYLSYANNFAKALHTYGINQTTNISHHIISVSSGNVIASNAWVPMDVARLIGAFIKGYEVAAVENLQVWAKDLAQAFWAKRNVTTDIAPLCIDSNGTVLFDFWKTNLDPIQNVLLYAYEVTKDNFYLSLTINMTEADLTYAWSEELGRTVQSVWMNGTIRVSAMDLIDGPQMYIIGLLQLSQFAADKKYLMYAEKMWNTICNNASVNNLYFTYLYEDNTHNHISSLYTQQMMVQCNAFLFHFTKNQTYFNNLKKTVNSFLVHYKMPNGFCHSINVTSYETVFDSTFDWLDSSSYTLGAAIYAYSVYSMQNTTSIEADMTYYVPYYPMFKIKGSLNYTNNKLCFKLKGASSYLNVTFTLPQGKTVSSITVNGSSFYLYAENDSHLLIWEPGSYEVALSMVDGISQNVFFKEFEFVNYTLRVTIASTEVINVTVRLHIPFNETSQTPFPKDAWDVNCTQTLWENIWDSMNRILTIRTLCNYSTAIIIENLPPKASELFVPEEVTENSVKLKWKEAAARDFAKYEILLSSGENVSSDYWTTIDCITEKSNTTYMVTGLLPNTTYYFIVRTYDTAGLYGNSQHILIKTMPSPPSEFQIPPQVIVSTILVAILAMVFLLSKRKLNNRQNVTRN